MGDYLACLTQKPPRWLVDTFLSDFESFDIILARPYRVLVEVFRAALVQTSFALPAYVDATLAIALADMDLLLSGPPYTTAKATLAMDELTEYLANSAEDGFWEQIQSEARQEAEREPVLVSFLFAAVLRHATLEDGLSVILANKLQTPELSAILLRDLISDALADDVPIRASIRADLLAARTRDPAARGYAQPFLYYKGFHALQAYRVTHWLWGHERYALAAHLQNRISEAFGVDVHPAARIGSGIIIDHGTSVVIGETAVVEDNVSLLHEVTLGGTGKERGDRHPKVRRGVLIGAGAKILGNIEVGLGAKVAAGSVVLRDVPPGTTVAGIPARVVGRCTVAEPALEMDATFPFPIDGGAGI